MLKLLISPLTPISLIYALPSLKVRDVTVPANIPGGWSSQGCYLDSTAARTLSAKSFTDTTGMTIESCITFCSNADYVYAGTEYSQECYCANTIASTGTKELSSDCNMGCTGKLTEACGGPNRLNIFWSGQKPPAGPASKQSIGSWASLGCYTDDTAARTLPTLIATVGSVTAESCTAACQDRGYLLAGMEYSQECYCANEFHNSGAPALDGCTMACAGDSSELCGGSFRLNVYAFDGTFAPPTTVASTATKTTSQALPTGTSGWMSVGCYTDNVNSRTLSIVVNMNGANTIEACTAACFNSGYPYAGVEYANECYCDSTIRNSGAPAPDGNALCDMACSGNAGEICGGPNRLNMFKYNGQLPAQQNPTPPAGNGGNSDVGPVKTGLPGSWHYAGCYLDGANGRILTTQQPDSNTLTVESCVSTCSGLGYTLSGTEYSTQCFCSNYVANGGKLASTDTDCNMGCSGKATEACGGPNRISLYSSTTSITAYPVPAAQTTGLPGSWAYKGCLAEPGANKVWPYKLVLQSNNSAMNCLSLCSKYGYPAGGMEYSDECYCGDIEDIQTNGGTVAPETDCSMSCSGDPTHLCGGSNRLSYYEWVGNSLQTWHKPPVTGHYEFLIGSPVVPLVATLGVNNKVTFVEKYGTGPPNSTGAYELDLSLVNNYNAAWRTMHVKSDVFCSASIILPDKGGRQINIGGWSLESTYGVRLYLPDGQPGVQGKNDWQENVDEVFLQRGRWYPSAMIMANGSILVVGGEDGSNGPPVPSLEIMPRVPGGDTVLTMDWLQRTDPYNLYPFCFVLPSGGILVIYYNEARILNEATFATSRTLPNVPGAVNDFTAGRTYPMEGTAVMLPQHAPYTDPATVMVCGGSTLGPAVALDNCVSITPDVPGAQWTIERMPSKRVMTCMVPLPDGTYMILNGAQQGVAGFGLATEPNLQALLYDPGQAVGSRFSVLNTTIVDRMYHSEAILLQDGRVLVSGSDPEDSRFPQEYRIEVYVPPYLSKGLPQPSYTITNTDWAYGGNYPITVTLHSGSTSTMKVSLIAAVSSTHGNSMNNRVIFPAFACIGNTCTITAPPNAHVCPPSWFQLFVLDNGTPSYSQWVRIGGDPAHLGNWPPYADFTRPGV